MSRRVSVIVPMFNAAPWIRQALSSAFEQTGAEVEVLVVDDGSTDNGAAIVREEFRSAQLICLSHGGVSRARNTGTAAASGDFLQYLDADDVLAPGKIAAQLHSLEQSRASVAYGDWQELSDTSSGQVHHPVLDGDPELALFTSFWCPPATYLFRREIIEAAGGFSEALPVIQDARLVLDCAMRGARFARAEGLAAYYRVHSAGSLSRRDPAAFVRDCLTNARQVESLWKLRGLTDTRRAALIEAYAYVARASFGGDTASFEAAYAGLERLQPGYRPRRPRHLAYAARVVGYRRAEVLAAHYRRAKSMLRAVA